MSNQRIVFILIVLILFLTALRIPWLWDRNDHEGATVKDGVIDFSEVNFNEEPIQTLRGKWEFYPGVLLVPEELQQKEEQLSTGYISLPGKWAAFFAEDTAWEDRQGTFRISIKVPAERVKRLYQIQLPRNSQSSKVYVNGYLLLDNDFELQKNGTMVSNAEQRSTSFRAGSEDELEVLIQFKGNSLAKRDGLKKAILFGDDTAINKAAINNIAKQLLIVAIALICAVYTFVFFIIRRGKLHFLYFSLASFCLAISTGLDDDRIFQDWIQLNYSGYVKLMFLTYIGIVVFLLLFVRDLFKEQVDTGVTRAMNWLLIAGVAAVIVSPLRYLSIIVTLIFVVLGVSLVVMALLIWKLARGRNRETIFLMIAAVSGANSFLWAIYRSRLDVDLPYYPYDILVAFISLSIFLFLLFFRIGNENSEMTLKLQTELKRKDQFLSNTAHEMKNPLHGMMNIAYSLLQQEGDHLSAEAKNKLGLMTSISRHMSITVNDLLDIARINEHTLQLKVTSVDMEKLVNGIVEMLNVTIRHKKIQVTIDISDSLKRVQADENRMIQILFNLIQNAVKFTDQGAVHIHGETKGNNAVLTIQDSGAGVEPEMLEKIFEPYTQGENSSGLGLGLAISRQLAELHGGNLEAVSDPEEGSAFILKLPLRNPKADTEPLASSVTRDHLHYATLSDLAVPEISLDDGQDITGQPARILMVDDDPVNLKVLSDILSGNEYEVKTVSGAEEAMKWIDEQPWDLVVTDVMMPNVSGYRLTRLIREKFSYLELPVLQLTARNHPEDIYNGFLSGANDYVAKPVSGLELKARVDNLTRLKKSVSERLQVEGAWLQAQIKPHFLFNTLNSIVSLGQFDMERMAALMDQFGNYLRRSFTPDNLNRLVNIEHEVELVRSYLYIEQERFGSRLKVDWKTDRLDGIKVPPLSIQTLVENAVQHGILKRVEGGTIEIIIRKSGAEAEISIVDDGVGMDDEKISKLLSDSSGTSGIGIINTDKRLKQLYGEGLKIDSKPGRGTSVTFRTRPLDFAE